MLYSELRFRNYPRISRVIVRGLSVAVLAYCITGYFGYATFVNRDSVLNNENILEAPYADNIWISIARISQFISVLTLSPLMILPCKEAIEKLSGARFSIPVNFFVTLILVGIVFLLSILLSTVGDALTIVGSTITPGLGFLVPIVFYTKMHWDQPFWTPRRLVPALVGLLIVGTSIIDVYTFLFYKKY